MKNAVFVHVVNGLDYLVHVELDSLLRQVVASTLDCFVHVHIHEFKNKGESACRFVIKYFVKSYDVGMG